MRTKTVNFETGAIDKPLGYVGENNETQLIITPPVELSEDTAIVNYVVAFGAAGNVYRSAAIAKAETISCDLWQEATSDCVVTIQLEGTDNDGRILAKSQMIVGTFLPSVAGTDAGGDPELSPLVNQVIANTAARHTHDNKDVLDEIPDYTNTDRGKFLGVSGDGRIRWNTIEITVAEIAQTETYSVYTASQLITMEKQGYTFTYQGEPVMATGRNVSETEFYFVVSAMDGSNTYITTRKVENNRLITRYGFPSDCFLIKSVNGKSPAASADIIIEAGDIQASESWTPANDTDIATKKYVDDNIPETGITEKVLELVVDYETLFVAQMFGNGDEVLLAGNQIASGGLLYNARITGIEGYISGQWSNIYSVYAAGNFPTVPSIPFVLNDGADDWTIIAYTDMQTGIIDTATKVRIHYIEISDTEIITP